MKHCRSSNYSSFHNKKEPVKRSHAFVANIYKSTNAATSELLCEKSSRNVSNINGGEIVKSLKKRENTFLYSELQNRKSSFKLPESIIEIIHNLEKEIIANIPTDIYENKKNFSFQTDYINENSNYDEDNAHFGNKYCKNQNKSNKKQDVDFNCRIKITDLEYKTASLEQNITFKPTQKIEAVNSSDKAIKDIRIILNKMSDVKFDSQLNMICEIMDGFFKEQQENRDDGDPSSGSSDTNSQLNENTIVFCKKLLDLVSMDTFNSIVYSKLYKEWTCKYPIFNKLLHDFIAVFDAKIDDDFHYVDSNVDYDGYCKYIKKNDQRKAISLFLVNLSKQQPSVLSKLKIVDILNHFLDKSIEYIQIKDKLNEVEEMSDNIYVILTNIYSCISSLPQWNDDILPKITNISQMKIKQYPSISNRVIFKYMDILDSLQ